MTVYDEILKWSESRPMWQRDALRRLVVTGELNEADVAEFALSCKEANGLKDPDDPAAKMQPLSKAHLPVSDGSRGPVTLLKISDVQNVNALASSDPLVFAPNGLTVIYGNNGAGKSGYVRILKTSCRCRDSSATILPNVFADGKGDIASAEIEYGVDNNVVQFHWRADVEGLDDLSRISVFDGESAKIYVNEENPAAYTPLGLDLLESLARVSSTLREQLIEERGQYVCTLPEFPNELAGTAEGQWLERLSSRTSPDEINTRASFSKTQADKLQAFEQTLREPQPAQKAVQLRQKIKRYRRLSNHLQMVQQNVGDTAVGNVNGLRDAFELAHKAARAASKSVFANDPELLPGVGTDVWKELWLSAKKYAAAAAYPGKNFPSDRAITRCVLCHQKLSDIAAKRLVRFDAFIKDDTAQKCEAAKKNVQNHAQVISQITFLSEDISTIIEELRHEREEIAARIKAYLQAAAKRREILLATLRAGQKQTISPLPSYPALILTQYIQRIEQEAVLLEKSSTPEQTELLRQKEQSLKARKWLAKQIDAIRREVNRKKSIECLERAIGSLNTKGITDQCTDLTEKYVTEGLRESFERELKHVYGGQIGVALLKTRGEQGRTYHKIQLVNSQYPDVEVSDIASEGEFRAIALAAFLAELENSPIKDAVVFDDPVSSHDHLVRERVAERLVLLAQSRQVVLFTHDLFFAVSLTEETKKRSLSILHEQVVRYEDEAGICEPDVPWDAKTVIQRIKILRGVLPKSKSLYRNRDPLYREVELGICDKMRQAVERSIEQILISKVVERFRRSVQTQQLRELAKITRDDCEFLDGLMTKYSRPLHDQKETAGVEIPAPDDVLEDVNILDKWQREFTSRPKT